MYNWNTLHCIWRLVLVCAVLEFRTTWANVDMEFDRRHYQYSSFMNGPFLQLNKNKVNTLGLVLKRHVAELRHTENKKVDMIFLVDSSSSVGIHDFFNEVKFVRKLLADFTVDSSHTRVSVVTFSSKRQVLRQIDYISENTEDQHKCSLLQDDIPNIKFKGGGTYTLGAFLHAKDILSHSRPDSKKAIFLITDGFSNGGDPRPEARFLRRSGVKIFTFGIRNGNVHELLDMASEPKNETCYILDTFEEFESLARRALHEDLSMGTFMEQPADRCSHLCADGGDCCDHQATCACGTHVGQYLCVCQHGRYGTGLEGECFPCPPGTYKKTRGPGDVTSCQACPDINHTTEPGATSVSMCFCKKGFRSMNETECSALTCPRMMAPKHGYFVNDKCNNVFNAACGMKCKPGYELRGSSLRICQEGGVWSGTPTKCIMKTCPALPRPKNGNMICSNDDFTFSTICRFTCDTGYKLVGSRKRECLANALWTGIPTRCREITCQPLASVRDGNVFPAMCNLGEVSFGTTCQILCYAGYTLVGPARKQCTPDGMWAPAMDGEMSRCDDTEAPLLHCPFDIVVEADDTESTAEVDWIVPLALDNSGFRPSVTVVPAVEPPKRFPIGLTAVKYIAEDHMGNMAKCHFTVVIKDVTPPTVDQCYSPQPFVSSERYATATWSEPMFSDNSGETVRMEISHEQGLFPQGKTTVRYTAFDESGNNNTCDVDITVIPHPCQYPDPPVSGERECYETDEGVYCHMTCNEGYAFAIPPAEQYFCAYDDVWRPEDRLPIPDCSVKTLSDGMTQPASITYLTSVPCTEHSVLNEIQLTFERKVTHKVNSLCSDNFLCTVDNFQTTCEQTEDFNTIRVVLGRDKRSVQSISKRSAPGITASSTITFEFDIKGEVVKTGNVTADVTRQGTLTDDLSKVLNKLEQNAVRGELDLVMNGKKMQFANMTYDTKGPQFNCNPGSVAVTALCVRCPIGTFFNIITEQCDECQTGSFQPNEGQITCVVCPSNTSTHGNRSRTEHECKALCLPGTLSKDGLERCSTCPIGTYQTMYGRTSCDPCPNNQTTIRRGSREVTQCRDRCVQGHVSKSGLEPCYPCPRGTYQPEVAMSSCFRCPGEGKTLERASTSLSDCEGAWDTEMQADVPGEPSPAERLEVNECFGNKCQNGATCNFGDFGFNCDCLPGYEGLYCETLTDECDGNPCLNEGVCEDRVAHFFCQCAPGYTGTKCGVDIDNCETSPCQNNGTCVDDVNAFVCSCATGYQGTLCERLTDDCQEIPCQNGGSCQNVLEGYTCSCPTGYEGVDCEINTDECESSPCQNGAQCADGIGAFSCQCVPGYTGKTCDVDIDECALLPCSPAATCEDITNGYVCHCPSGFTGAKCESELLDNYMLDFPTSGIINYTTTTIGQDMDAVTASFWMRTDDDTNQGTPFSYSSSNEMDNAFTLTNYEGFVLSVNNHKQVTDVYANDGLWHHIIVTWASDRGSWKMYKDGVAWDSGYNLAAGEIIAGGGTFVVGQEQDSDGFSSSESFIGQLTRLNVWSMELPLTTIDEMRVSCDAGNGDVIAWPDIQSGMRGTLTAEPSNFCRGDIMTGATCGAGDAHSSGTPDLTFGFCEDCPVPVEPTYGVIEYSGTTPGSLVTYACLRGFYVAGMDRRQCLVTGEWEGQRTPTCQRDIMTGATCGAGDAHSSGTPDLAFGFCEGVECGFPGTILNGYVDGDQFNYDNRVRYTCYEGYRLIGNQTRYCNAEGNWEGTAPTCRALQCHLPELSENTIVLNSSRTFAPRDVIAFGCEVGHRMYTSHSTVVCQLNGTFDKSLPSCDLQTCKAPPIVDMASPSDILRDYSVGFILSYICDFAYELSQTSENPTGQIRCLPSGEWEQNLPVCSIITCRDPPTVINGNADWTDTSFLSSAIYSCDAGYTIAGEDNVLECIESGTWYPPPPECIPVDCGVPDNVPNSIIKADRYTYRSIATYQCNGGYEIQGNPQISCLQNGSWSSGLPRCTPASCGPPESIENGRFIGNEFTYGQTVRYQCDNGFLIGGVEERTCGQDGHWTSQIPSCRRRECEKPPSLLHGYFTNSGFYFEDQVLYSCNIGYLLQGDTTSLSCQADGSWAPQPPTCSPVECPSLRDIPNGRVEMHGRTFTSKVEYFCNPGYEFFGESIRICQPEGYWSSSAPSCTRGSCRTPLSISNGKVNFKELKLNSVAVYECDSGFILEGSDVRRCIETLTWSDEDPRCKPVVCSDPPKILNGRRSYSRLTFNSVATYYCDTGFTLHEGSFAMTCSAAGVWNGDIPVCELVTCESPSTVTSNGRMIGSNFTYGNSIRYECDVGYDLEGAANRTCLASGKWDAPIPICRIVTCNRAFLANGSPSGFQREYGSHILFTCRSRYVLFGSSERTCLEDGQWSGPSPVCVVCEDPPTVEFATLSVENGVATYQCVAGYNLTGSSQLNCRIDGIYPDRPPRCVPNTCPILDEESFTNGTILLDGSIAGSYAQYECDEGFTLVGSNIRICLSDGPMLSWSEEEPNCIPVACGDPPEIVNGRSTPNGHAFKSVATYYCDTGFTLHDTSTTLTCTAAGIWSGVTPVCELVRCETPTVVSNGRMVGSNFIYGNTIRYECDVGYYMDGAANRTCLASGEWDTSIPVCEIVNCSKPFLANGSPSSSLMGYGAHISFTCNSGYVLFGSAERTCLEDGQWSGPSPVCVVCEDPPTVDFATLSVENGVATYQCVARYNLTGSSQLNCRIDGIYPDQPPRCVPNTCPNIDEESFTNGSIVLNGSISGSYAQYECDEGFTIVGSNIRMCLSDGLLLSWSEEEPNCIPVTCSDPPEIVNGRSTPNGLRFKSVATYYCDTGFTLHEGSATLTCTAAGIWSGVTPVCELVRCETPTVVSNGRMVGSNFTYDNTIRYECDVGYNVDGAANRTCLASGEWDTSIPVCEIVNCNMPSLANGSPSSYLIEYGSPVSFTCNSGYVLFGSAERTCLEDGQWSGPSPVCVVCEDPPAVHFATYSVENGAAIYVCNSGYDLEGSSILNCRIDGIYPDRPPVCVPKACTSLNEDAFSNGRILLDGNTAGSFAIYVCDEGFILVGFNKRRCLSDGLWSGDIPSCNIIRCAGSFSVENGNLQGVFDNVYRTVLTFICNEGFAMVGYPAVTCQADGSWNGTEPTCEQIMCPAPEKIMHGEVTVTSVSYSSVVTYTCEAGYEANGPLTRTCGLDGTWSDTAPNCIAIACHSPQPIKNGEIIGSTYHLGSQIRYRCKPGHILDSVSFRLCLYSKMWSGPEPNCNKVRCRSPRPPRNGRITSTRRDTYLFEDVIDVECNEGYEMTRGNPTRTCLANRRWSLPFPRCAIIMCDDIPAKPNADTTLLNGSSTYGSMLEVRCKRGFKSIGGSYVTATCQSSGRWSAVRIECSRAECEDLPTIVNGRVIGDSFLFGDTITIQCDDGYSISGDSTLTCRHDTTWSASTYPTCSIISCGNPDEFENGQIHGSVFDYNQEITYRCQDGYSLIGSERRRCELNGLWSDSPPTCRLVTCSVQSIWRGSATVIKAQYVVSDIVSYVCDEGYVMVSNTDLTCTSNGTWSGALPQCDIITCPKPEQIFNGEVMNSDTVYGSRAIYTCDLGFELDGKKVLTCIENGRWSAEYPACNPVSCGEPNFVANSGRVGDVYTFGNILTYFCEDGYDLVGDDIIVCLEDTSWSSFPPQCEPISCGSPPDIPDAISSANSFRFKDEVFYKCETGYELSGNNIIRCESTSLWEGNLPTCQPVECGPPPVLPHSTTIVTTTTFGSVVTFHCNSGFILRGDPMAKCSENETWAHDSTVACIAIDCGPPPTFPNTNITYALTNYPSLARYNCVPGYVSSGNDVMRCNEIGQWIGTTPRCEKDSCGPPKTGRNVLVVGGDHFLGGTLTFSCLVGYTIVGETTATCTSSGEWSSDPPECQVVSCGDFPLFDRNVIIRSGMKDNYVFGDNIAFICNEGFVLGGIGSSRCLANGRWSATDPVCIEVNVEACPDRNDFANARTIPSAYRVGEMYTVECMTGYRSVGNMEITCTAEHVWSIPSGICRRVSCGKPRITDMVNVIRISGRSHFYGDKVRFRCRPGIAPIKVPPILTCLDSGQWDGKIACSLPCKGGCFNGGRCIGLYGCKCPAGYGGRRCEKAICILPCLHGGTCTAPYLCSCRPDYTGVRCQKPICNQPCQNGGRCFKPNRCQCPHGYKRPFCTNG